ncbi:MAG: adenylate/guanylate cyclase domain-containing protein [Methylococcaceae bacterium]|nr:adenylate/guanylate cyclase domain-containing protein [Methylococcaceae bacterium]
MTTTASPISSGLPRPSLRSVLQWIGNRHVRAQILALLLAFTAGLLVLVPWPWAVEDPWGLWFLSHARNVFFGKEVPESVRIVNIGLKTFLDDPELKKCIARNSEKWMPACWPRSRYGEIISTLRRQGATLSILNVLFTQIKPAEDAELAVSLKEAGNVLLQDKLAYNPISISKETGVTTELIKANPPIEQLAEAALATAPFPAQDSRGESIRFWTGIAAIRGPLDQSADQESEASLWPTLPVVALHVAALREGYDELLAILNRHHLRSLADILEIYRDDQRPEPVLLRLISNLDIWSGREPEALDAILADLERRPPRVPAVAALFRMYQGDDALYVNPYGPAGAIPTLPLSPEPPAEAVNGKVVVISPSPDFEKLAKGAKFATVFGEISSGELLATAYANLLEGRLIHPLPTLRLMLVTVVWGYLVGILAMYLPIGVGLLALCLSWILFEGAAVTLFRMESLWIPVVVPSFQVSAAILLGLTSRYLEQQQHLRELITIKIPASLMPILERADSPLAGDFVHCSGVCLVTDGEGYTALTDSRDGEWLAHFMQDYQTMVERPVREHGGTVKDWAGDGMLALWWGQAPAGERGATALLPGSLLRWRWRRAGRQLERRRVDRRSHALDAAIRLQEAVAEFTRRRQVHFPIRVGINFGPMWIAYAGELKAFGDTLNTTQRLEALNKVLGTRTLVSDSMVTGLAGYATRDLGLFKLPGRRDEVRVHELLGHLDAPGAANPTLLEGFADALERFEKGDWHGAFELFALLREDFPDDGPTRFYLKACRERLAEA